MKKNILFILALTLPVVASAYDIKVNNIYYNYIKDGTELEVTSGDSRYIGILNIPENVRINSINYKVTSIGEKAFYLSKNIFDTDLISVRIPNSVTNIGNYAFYRRYSLNSITIPNSVVKIGDGAFYGCSGLTSITIPNSVTTIGEDSFRDCLGLTSITIGDGIMSIGRSAFSGCKLLASINMGNNVTSIGSNAFKGCIALTSITIPNGIISIGDNVFSDCTGLTSVEIGSSVTSIGTSAFERCINITLIDIPDNVTSLGSNCFAYCSNLSNVSLSNNLSALGMGAFAGCSKLESVTVPGSIGILEGSVFQNCTGLKSVILSEGISEIGHMAFNGCTSLRSVALPSSLGKIESAFSGCSSLESITLPKNLTTINGSAFSGCSSLKKLIIEDGESELFFSNPYTTSNIVCFSDCPLESVYIGRNIGRDKNTTLFVENKTLKEVLYGENVTTINGNEFSGCENLSSLTFSKSINTISNNAFSGCKSLKNVTIPNNVTYIGSFAFLGCDNLKEITFEDGSTELVFGTEYDNRSWCFSGPVNKVYLGRNASCRFSPFTNVPNAFEVTIGKLVTELSGGIFASLKGISKLIIEANSEPLVFEEFYYSYQNTFMPFRNTPIESIYLDRYIVSKKHELSKQYPYAFRDVPSISALEIGSNVDKLAKDLFFSNCNITTLNIPKNVKTIEESAFMGSRNLSSVVIEDGEDKLEFSDGNTFYDCPLQNVYIGRNIGYPSNNSPFKNHKEGIESIILGENVTEISNEEFYGLKKIASVALPKNLKKIGSMAFYGCDGLTELIIPGCVTEIGQQAFDLCENLKTLRIEEGEAELKFTAEPNYLNNAFQNSPLEDVYIGRNFSFSNSSPLALFETLKSLTFSEEVLSIQARSFIGCPNLKDVTSYSKVVPTTNDIVFTPSYQTNATLHVPYALYDEYKLANVWKDFGKIVNFEGLYNLVYSVDGEEYKKYVVEQGTSITPEAEPTKEGYIFSGWSEIPTTMPAEDVIVTGTFTIDTTGIENVYSNDNNDGNKEYYNLNGIRIAQPKKGFNIVKMSDGSIKKIFIK